jgi:hypothetical protein
MPLIYSNRNKPTCHNNLKSYSVALLVSSSSSSSSRSSSCSHLVTVMVVVIVTVVAVIIVVTAVVLAVAVVVVVKMKVVIVWSPYLNFITIIVDRELIRTDKDHENAEYPYVFAIASDSVLREVWAQQEACRRLWVCSQIF